MRQDLRDIIFKKIKPIILGLIPQKIFKKIRKNQYLN